MHVGLSNREEVFKLTKYVNILLYINVNFIVPYFSFLKTISNTYLVFCGPINYSVKFV